MQHRENLLRKVAQRKQAFLACLGRKRNKINFKRIKMTKFYFSNTNMATRIDKIERQEAVTGIVEDEDDCFSIKSVTIK